MQGWYTTAHGETTVDLPLARLARADFFVKVTRDLAAGQQAIRMATALPLACGLTVSSFLLLYRLSS